MCVFKHSKSERRAGNKANRGGEQRSVHAQRQPPQAPGDDQAENLVNSPSGRDPMRQPRLRGAGTRLPAEWPGSSSAGLSWVLEKQWAGLGGRRRPSPSSGTRLRAGPGLPGVGEDPHLCFSEKQPQRPR